MILEIILSMLFFLLMTYGVKNFINEIKDKKRENNTPGMIFYIFLLSLLFCSVSYLIFTSIRKYIEKYI